MSSYKTVEESVPTDVDEQGMSSPESDKETDDPSRETSMHNSCDDNEPTPFLPADDTIESERKDSAVPPTKQEKATAEKSKPGSILAVVPQEIETAVIVVEDDEEKEPAFPPKKQDEKVAKAKVRPDSSMVNGMDVDIEAAVPVVRDEENEIPMQAPGEGEAAAVRVNQGSIETDVMDRGIETAVPVVAEDEQRPAVSIPSAQDYPELQLTTQRNSRTAIASLVLGILGLCAPIIPIAIIISVVAIITGLVALNMIQRNPDQLKWARMAIVGIALGILEAIAWICVLVYVLSK